MAMIYDSFTITVVEDAGRPRLLREGRGRPVCIRRAVAGGLGEDGQVPHQHRRRRPVLQPPGYAGHLPAAGSHPANCATSSRERRARWRIAKSPCATATGGSLGARHSGGTAILGRGLANDDDYIKNRTRVEQAPAPTVVGETRPYWQGCRQGELLIQKCVKCGEYQFYPRGICANCWSDDGIRWVQASGKGTVWTYTVTYQNRTPALCRRRALRAGGGGAGRGGKDVHQHSGLQPPRSNHRHGGGG